MTRDATLHPNNETLEVDWEDPKLQELLKKSEGLRLDGRGAFKQRPVQLWMSAQAGGVARDGRLVGDTGKGVLTVLAGFPLERGMPVSLGIPANGSAAVGRQVCQVLDCRLGNRTEDKGRKVYVIHLKTRAVG